MKKRLVFLALVILTSLVSVSCSQFFPTQEQTPPATTHLGLTTKEAAVPSTQQERAKTVEKKASEQMIIRQKTVRLKVNSVKKAVKKIEALATKYQGYVTHSIISSDESGIVYPEQLKGEQLPTTSPSAGETKQPLTGTVIVKVPYKSYQSLLKDLKKLGETDYELESTEEVTEEYIDLQARIRNLRREEERYLDFLDAAKNIKEMLQVEEQISRVRGEIEKLEAEADYLKKRAAMSTITVQLYEPGRIIRPAGRDWGFVRAITQAIRNFVIIVNFLIMFLGAVAPLAILALVALWIIRFIWRRGFGRQKQK